MELWHWGLLIVNGLNLGIVKPLVARPRPLNNPDLQGFVVAVNHYMADGYSFFSSHTANAFVIAVFFSLLVRDRSFLFLMIAWSIMVSLTRPYLGVHYPSDVFVGMIFGSSVAVFIYFLYLRIYIRFSDKLHYISTKYTRTGYSFADIDVVLVYLYCHLFMRLFEPSYPYKIKLCLKIQNILAFLITTIHSLMSASPSFR